MRLTTKGQVTIPLAIRRRLGLAQWSEVEFKVQGNRVYLQRKSGSRRRGEQLLRAMRSAPKPKPGMTTDQLMALTRG
jgi:AbrB family looped-hinge helix DNA binding protein